MPRVSIGVFIDDNPCGKWSQLINDPIYLACVLSTLILSSALLEKLLRISNEFGTRLMSERVSVMSSARRLILISFLSILIPFIYVSFLILFARVCKAVLNKYADNGQPCHTPLSS